VVAPDSASTGPGVFFTQFIVHTQTVQGKINPLAYSVFRVYTSGMKTTPIKRRGRSLKGSDRIKGIRLDMRLDQAEKDAFRAAAELAGLDMSGWIRERLRQVAKKELENAGLPVAFLVNIRLG
jgi:hypothetical protein